MADDSEVMFGQQEEIAGAREWRVLHRTGVVERRGWRTRSLTEGHGQGWEISIDRSTENWVPPWEMWKMRTHHM